MFALYSIIGKNKQPSHVGTSSFAPQNDNKRQHILTNQIIILNLLNMASKILSKLVRPSGSLFGARGHYANESTLAPSKNNSQLEEVQGDSKKMPAPQKTDICRGLLYPDQMDWLDDVQVRISRPSKNVMQSGTSYMNTWKIEFNSQKRWENWLMGWTSSGDPVSNLTLNFPSKEEAIKFCDKNKLQWYVEEQPERKLRRKSYADNFSWNKRTRLGNK